MQETINRQACRWPRRIVMADRKRSKEGALEQGRGGEG
jgi:hypothetical protein